MGAKDYIQIEVPRLPEYVAVLRRVLEVVAVRARIPQGDLLVIRQVLGEACSRAVTVRAYTGHGDILRLRCTPAPGATVEAPAVLLVLEAPAAHFQCTVAGGAPDGEAGGVESESTDALSASLVGQFMEKVTCRHTGRGTMLSFVCRFAPAPIRD